MLRPFLFKTHFPKRLLRCFFVSQEPFNESDFDPSYHEYLKNIKKLTYTDLLLELRKYPGKPPARTKIAILKYIAESLPKSGVSLNKPIFPNMTTINTPKGSADIGIPPEIDENEMGENMDFPLSNLSLYENEMKEGSLNSFLPMFFCKTRNFKDLTPFIENYSPNQILAEAHKTGEANLRNEIIAVNSRSNLFKTQSQSLESRLRSIRKREIKRVFYELTNLIGEHMNITSDHLVSLMNQIKEHQIYNYTLNQVVRNLADSVLCLNYISFFKGAPLNLVNLTWEALCSMIDGESF